MNAIIGMTELVLDTELDVSQRDYLKTVQESGESLLSVINDVLDFSKIEAGKLDLVSEPFDLRESLGDTMKSLAVRAHSKGLELACEIPPDVPDRFVGDAGRLRQIFVNLVGNAIKFTESGEVVLRVTHQVQPDDDVVLQFAVIDTGIGIPEEKRAAIFDAFEQVDNSTTRRFAGTGLGLAISSKLIRLMGGEIWLESDVGSGSTFFFTVPFSLARGEATDLHSATQVIVRDTRVLVVDDNATNRHILQEMLRSWGMKPAAAGGAHDALDLLRRGHHAGKPYTVVVTDANMPEVDGFTLAEQIKRDTELGSTIIMMLTSGDRLGDVARCEQLGIAAYLLKPVKQSELLDAIVMALGITGLEDELPRSSAPEQPSRLPPLRVLLVEDSLVNQKLAVGPLEKHGQTVVVANHGREALAAWEAQDFDLVLMDVQMPEMDGFEATAAIRVKERRTGRRIPIIAMTAHAMTGDRERCLEANMDDYVAKPIHARQLFAAIEKVLGLTPSNAHLASEQTSAEGTCEWTKVLEAVRGDHSLLKTIVEAALEDCQHQMSAIQQAITSSDANALRWAAHTLKGAIDYFGQTEALKQALHLEEMARGDNLESAEQVVIVLEEKLGQLTKQLAEYLRSCDGN